MVSGPSQTESGRFSFSYVVVVVCTSPSLFGSVTGWGRRVLSRLESLLSGSRNGSLSGRSFKGNR